MAEIQPFPGILFDVAPGELERVLAPPYDVIPPDYQDELYGRDPRNIVRVILNRSPGEAAYTDAAAQFEHLLSDGTLRRDGEPALYVLEQTFQAQDRVHTRRGLLARFRAEPYETGHILPHEQTRAAPKEDRYKLLLATRANFSPIFMMVADARHALRAELAAAASGVPAVEVTDDGGVRHRLWRVTGAPAVERFRGPLAARAYIADGHHRYATALRFAGTPGGTPWTFGYFTPLEDDGLVVLPYHRILGVAPDLEQARAALEGLFDLHEVRGTHEAAERAAHSHAAHAFGLVQPGAGGLLAEARPAALERLGAEVPACLRALDTYFLHRVVLGPLLGVSEEAVSYVHSLGEAERAVAEDRCRMAVLLRAAPVRQIVDVAEARESMPAKSTFFHPKLPSGLVIHPVDA